MDGVKNGGGGGWGWQWGGVLIRRVGQWGGVGNGVVWSIGRDVEDWAMGRCGQWGGVGNEEVWAMRRCGQ